MQGNAIFMPSITLQCKVRQGNAIPSNSNTMQAIQVQRILMQSQSNTMQSQDNKMQIQANAMQSQGTQCNAIQGVTHAKAQADPFL